MQRGSGGTREQEHRTLAVLDRRRDRGLRRDPSPSTSSLGFMPAGSISPQGKLYTLSEGTRKALGKLEAPVKIRFYFNQGDANVPVGMRVFAGRVEDLLNELRAASNGKLVIEKLNPQPDSDAEDSANLDGVEAQELPSGEKFYLGLAVSFADQKLALPVLSPDRERLLEYDVARAIARVTTTTKPLVGVMSRAAGVRHADESDDGHGRRRLRAADLRERAAARFRAEAGVDGCRQDRRRHQDAGRDPSARASASRPQFALDQFVLRGGKLIVFLDPYAYFDQMPGPMGGQGGSSSNIGKLLKAWGYELRRRQGRARHEIHGRVRPARRADGHPARCRGDEQGRRDDQLARDDASRLHRRVRRQARRRAEGIGADAHLADREARRHRERDVARRGGRARLPARRQGVSDRAAAHRQVQDRVPGRTAGAERSRWQRGRWERRQAGGRRPRRGAEGGVRARGPWCSSPTPTC